MEMGSNTTEHWKPGEGMRMSGLRWRIGGSIVAGIGWLIFVLLYAAFWSGPFTLIQSVVIVVVSFLVLAGLLGVMWASFGMKFMR